MKTRQRISLLLILIMVLQMLPSTGAIYADPGAVNYIEDFESEDYVAEQAYPNTEGLWASGTMTIKQESDGNKYLRWTDVQSGSMPSLKTLNGNQAFTGENVILSFQFKFESLVGNEMFILRNSTGAVAADIRFYKSGTGYTIGYKHSAAQTDVRFTNTYQLDTWYTMVIEYHSTAGNYNLAFYHKNGKLIDSAENVNARYDTAGNPVDINYIQLNNFNRTSTIICLDNVYMADDPDFEIKEEPVASPGVTSTPETSSTTTASDLKITGTPEWKSVLTGSYTFHDTNGNAEQGTIEKWYVQNEIIDVWKEVATGSTYTVTANDAYGARMIKYEVTPVNDKGERGETQSVIIGPAQRTDWEVAGTFVDSNEKTHQEFTERDGLPNFMNKLKNGQSDIKIGYLGGSITHWYGYRSRTIKWLEREYPDIHFTDINAGVSGTPAELGVARVNEQVMSQNPDLVFVEFAVNGGNEEQMEGIVRKIWQANPNTDIIFVYTANQNMLKNFQSGAEGGTVTAFEKVAEYYGIPSIRFHVDVARLYFGEDNKDGTGNVTESFMGLVSGSGGHEMYTGDKIYFTRDGTHTFEVGDQLYADAFIRSVEKMQEKEYTSAAHTLPAAMSANNWSDANMYDNTDSRLTYSGTWTDITDDAGLPGKDAFKNNYDVTDYFTSLKWADEPSDTLTFQFRGTQVGVFDFGGPDSGRIKFTYKNASNGEVVKETIKDRFTQNNTYYRHEYVYADTVPYGDYEVTISLVDTPRNDSDASSENWTKKRKLYNDAFCETYAEDIAHEYFFFGKLIMRGELLDGTNPPSPLPSASNNPPTVVTGTMTDGFLVYENDKYRFSIDLSNVNFGEKAEVKLVSGDEVVGIASLDTDRYPAGSYSALTCAMWLDNEAHSWITSDWNLNADLVPTGVELWLDNQKVDSGNVYRDYSRNPLDANTWSTVVNTIAPPTESTVFHEDDFDAYQDGSAFADTRWTGYNRGTIKQKEGTADNYLELVGGTGYGTPKMYEINGNRAFIGSNVVSTFQFNFGSTNQMGMFILRTGSGNVAADIRMQSAGDSLYTMYLLSGAGSTRVDFKNSIQYSIDTWYRLVVEYDTHSGRYDVFIYDENGSLINSAEEVEARYDTKVEDVNVNYWQFNNIGTSTALRLDDVYTANDADYGVPFVKNVALQGSVLSGQDVTITYRYTDRTGDAENGSVYKIYAADTADATTWNNVIASGTCSANGTITIPAAANGKYIRVGVTPKNANSADADKSAEVLSDVIGPVVETAEKPVAEVTLSGSAELRATLTAAYTYFDANGDVENGSVYQWLSADEADSENWTVEDEGTCTANDELTFVVPDTYNGKYIKFTVAPKNDGENGTGDLVESNIIGPIGESTAKPYASDITFGGQVVLAEEKEGAAIGGEITAKYIYKDLWGRPEDTAKVKYQWYTSYTATGAVTPIDDATSSTYIPTEADGGKYLRLGVTVTSQDGLVGDEVISDGFLVRWKLAFADEFSYAAGSNGYSEDVLETWMKTQEYKYVANSGQPVVPQLRIPDNLQFTGSTLQIVTKKEHLDTLADGTVTSTLEGGSTPHEWTTARITTKETFGPDGYAEAKFKFAEATGMNNSFWTSTRGINGNQIMEVDFCEGHYPNEAKSTVHTNTVQSAARSEAVQFTSSDPNENLGTSFHTYGGYFENLGTNDNGTYRYAFLTYLDNKQWRSDLDFDCLDEATGHHLILSNILYPGWTGAYDPDNSDGSVMEVDYVRFFEPLAASTTDLDRMIQTVEEELNSAVAGTETGNYPQSAIDTLNGLLPAAKEILNQSNPAQDDINTVIDSLMKGLEVFKASAVGDRTVLSELISQAEELMELYPSGTEFMQCNPATFEALKNAVDEARAVVDADYPTQAELDEKADSLQELTGRYLNSVNFSGTVSTNQAIDLTNVVRRVEFTVPADLNPTVTLPEVTQNSITITRYLDGQTYVKLTIPAGTKLTGDFTLPSAQQITSEEYDVTYSVAMAGLQAENNLIRIELSHSGQKKVGVVKDNSITEIVSAIQTDSQDAAKAAIGSGNVVKYSGNIGWILYAKTLEDYIIYSDKTSESPSPTPTPNNNNNNNSNNNNSNWIPGIILPPNNDNNNGTDKVKFTDISGHWAENEIIELAEDGIIKGRSETEFVPEDSMTRAEFAALIRRALNLQTVAYQNTFHDVDGWFADEVQAVVQAGIMSGDTDGNFRPDDAITRQEMAKVIVNAYRYRTGINTVQAPDIAFDDSGEIALWASEYVKQAVGLGLLNGMGDNMFSPLSNMTRAQGATVISRLIR